MKQNIWKKYIIYISLFWKYHLFGILYHTIIFIINILCAGNSTSYYSYWRFTYLIKLWAVGCMAPENNASYAIFQGTLCNCWAVRKEECFWFPLSCSCLCQGFHLISFSPLISWDIGMWRQPRGAGEQPSSVWWNSQMGGQSHDVVTSDLALEEHTQLIEMQLLYVNNKNGVSILIKSQNQLFIYLPLSWTYYIHENRQF